MTNSKQPALLFPGSFDPFTLGHASLVQRAIDLWGPLVIAVGYNEEKQGWLPVEERVRALREYYKDEPRVSVEAYTGLTTDFAERIGARAILRGLRSVKDYEYELHMADVNRRLTGVETVILFTEPHLSALSSSVVRELASFGRDVQEFLPAGLTYNIP